VRPEVLLHEDRDRSRDATDKSSNPGRLRDDSAHAVAALRAYYRPFDALIVGADRAMQGLEADEFVDTGQGISQGGDPPEVLLLCDRDAPPEIFREGYAVEHLLDSFRPLGQGEEEIFLVPADGFDDLADPVWLNALAKPICHRVQEDPGRGLAALPVNLLQPIRVKSGPEGVVCRIAEAAFQPPGYAGSVAIVAADLLVAEVAAAGDRVDGLIGPIDLGAGHSDRLRQSFNCHGSAPFVDHAARRPAYDEDLGGDEAVQDLRRLASDGAVVHPCPGLNEVRDPVGGPLQDPLAAGAFLWLSVEAAGSVAAAAAHDMEIAGGHSGHLLSRSQGFVFCHELFIRKIDIPGLFVLNPNGMLVQSRQSHCTNFSVQRIWSMDLRDKSTMIFC